MGHRLNFCPATATMERIPLPLCLQLQTAQNHCCNSGRTDVHPDTAATHNSKTSVVAKGLREADTSMHRG